MKNQKKFTYLAFLLLIIFSLSCKKDEEEETEEDLITVSYSGWLEVYFSNTIPPFEASTRIDVAIDKDLNMILFDSGTLSYSGDTILGNSSKIERAGNWTIEPTGDFVKVGDAVHINVDVGITLVSDIQKVYANDDGQWVLVNETNFASTPNSDIFFVLSEASAGSGSTVQVVEEGGSVRFTLTLVASLI